MGFKEFYFGQRKLVSEAEIPEYVKHSSLWNRDGDETIKDANTMVLFENTMKRSWLVSTNKRVYKLLDDKSNKRPIVNWSVKIEKFKIGLAKTKVIETEANLGKLKFPFVEGKVFNFDQEKIDSSDILDTIRRKLKL